MATFTDQTFTDETLHLDGNNYTGCTFTGCVLIYAGGPLEFRGNSLDGCKWLFGGPAANTLVLLSLMYRDEHLRAFTLDILNDIRQYTLKK